MKIIMNIRGLLSEELCSEGLGSPYFFFSDQKINVSSEEWVKYVKTYNNAFKSLSCLEYLFEVLSKKTKNFTYCDTAVVDLDELMDISERDKNIIIEFSESSRKHMSGLIKPSPFLSIDDSRDEYLFDLIAEISSHYDSILSCTKVKEKSIVKEKLKKLSGMLGSYYHI